MVNGNATPGGVGEGGAETNNTGGVDNDGGEDSDELNDVMEVLTRYGHQMNTRIICGSLCS